MGFLDDAKNKAQEFVNDNPDKVKDGLDKAGDQVNQRTDDKYADQVNKAKDAAADKLGGSEE